MLWMDAAICERSVSSLKVEGSTSVDNLDKKGQNGEGSGGLAGRIKGSHAVWALKRSDPGSRSLPGSSWQPVGVKEVLISNDGCGSGLGSLSPAVTLAGGCGSPPRAEDWGRPVATGTEPAAVASASTGHSSNGKWDEPVGNASSSWDSGWEVPGPCPEKKDEGMASRLRSDQKAKGGLRNFHFQANSSANPRGARQRSQDWDKVSRGVQSPGHGFHETGERPQPRRNKPRLSNSGPARQPAQSSWGTKSFNRPTSNNSPNLETPFAQGETSTDGNGAKGGHSRHSSSILGKLLPQGRTAPRSNRVSEILKSSSVPIDVRKGGFFACSGNGSSSVLDDRAASLDSDSRYSDDNLDSDTMSLASFESDTSRKSHSTQRMNKWFRSFFQDIDALTDEEFHKPLRQWRCPACQGGVGAIDRYRGLQPLLAHAHTSTRSKRVKLHKAFAELLEEEIRVRRAAQNPQTHGSSKYWKWQGLGDDNESKLIVWPPIVLVRNTQLKQDADNKWIGMENNELLDLFKKYNPVKARHAYGPQGHQGISILVFADSPIGYYNAQRLETRFVEACRGKVDWDAPGKRLVQPEGDRILYGYMATVEDMEIFNKHSRGKRNLKWVLRSFQDAVNSPLQKLDAENNVVTILQVKVQRQQETRRALTETVSQITKTLELREDELKIVRDRAKEQYQQQQIEMGDMEVSYQRHIEKLKKVIREKETAFERLHEEYKHERCEKLPRQMPKIPQKEKNLRNEQQRQHTFTSTDGLSGATEESLKRSDLDATRIENRVQWAARKVELLKEHHQTIMEFKARQWEDLLKFEFELDQERRILEASKVPAGVEGGLL